MINLLNFGLVNNRNTRLMSFDLVLVGVSIKFEFSQQINLELCFLSFFFCFILFLFFIYWYTFLLYVYGCVCVGELVFYFECIFCYWKRLHKFYTKKYWKNIMLWIGFCKIFAYRGSGKVQYDQVFLNDI